MARWLPLAAELGPERRRLTERLRLLKDRSGLSLGALAAKTSYSASSWQRCLNAAAVPPWAAAEALGKLGGAGRQDLVRLRVLWESAAEAKPTPRKSEAVPAILRTRQDGHREERREQPSETGSGPVGVERPQARTQAQAQPQVRALSRVRSSARLRSLAAGFAVVCLLAVPKSSGRTFEGPSWPWPAHPGPAADVADRVAQCRGPGCEGLDPVRTGCARDGRVLGRLDRDAQRLELKHSAHCGTVWGEVSPVRASDRLSVSSPQPAHLDERPGTGRTRMLPVPDSAGTGAQACLRARDAHACVASDNRSWTD
ncbi:helix-turn-helix domain-containing protein [Streptomyces sp. NPDC102283]|uniref:helix-turn-helix domain-containing protein n=1 Tax=Streptomyces sp. NPDC102283 TaxID=3366155 RepID=UPI0037F8EF4B